MLNLRYYTRLAREFVLRFKGLIFFGVVSGIIIFLFFRFFGPLIFGKGLERIGIAGRYRVDNLPSPILSMVGDGLTKLNEDGSVEPDLASSWETPDKGKTWIFHLASSKYWQDGKRVDAKGIVYEFSDTKIERPNDKTIVFKLQNPFSPFPSVVSKPTFRQGLLGTGAWRVTEVSLSGSVVQEIDLENKKRERKIFKFYPTEERTKLAYELGQVDEIINILNPEPFDKWKSASVTSDVNENQVVTIFFNTQDNLLKEKTIRQALAYAIKKEDFEGPRAISPISPVSWAYNPQVKTYNYDPGKAKELLDKLPKEAKTNLSIKLVTTPTLLDVADKVAKDWERVGIKTTLQVSSGIPTDYQALLAIFDAPEDPDQYAVWHSTQTASNISHYQNPRIDKLLEDGRTEVDLEKRKEIYIDFQRFLLEDTPAIFLYHPTFYDVKRR